MKITNGHLPITGTWKPVGNRTETTKQVVTTPQEIVAPKLAGESLSLSAGAALLDPPAVLAEEKPTLPKISTPSSPGFVNAPLTMDLDGPGPAIRFASNGASAEPVYVEELSVLESRYPGVAGRLKSLEMEAAVKGYCPEGSKAVEASVLESPPWPTTSFGDPRANISAKAKELQGSHPELNTGDASKYDFGAAAVAAEGLLEKLDGLFKDDLPDLAISTRAKTPKSLKGKMEKMKGFDPDYTLAHLTDTVGARVDAPDLKSMGEVANRLEKLYKGKIVAKSDYVSKPGANGYRAIHYIIDIGGRMAEIQTSTHNLRAADLATHDTVYKEEFPVTPETSKELSTAADRIMFLECLKASGSS